MAEHAPHLPEPSARSSWSGNELVAALRDYGVAFLASEEAVMLPDVPAPELVRALVSSPEARLRLALIPLLLQNPELAVVVPTILRDLPAPAALTLQCFYTAAHLLQQTHRARLEQLLGPQPALPDWFSTEIGISSQGTPAERLQLLGRWQQERSGRYLNWTGSYEHAAQRFLSRLALEVEWGHLQ